MPLIRVVNRTRGTMLGDRVRLANDLPGRLRGFLFRPPPATGEGILLSPCRAVHMYSVRFPLDVVFISEVGEVVATYRDLRPWKRSAVHGSARHALELPPGTIRASGTTAGDLLSWTAVDGENPARAAGPAGAAVWDAAVTGRAAARPEVPDQQKEAVATDPAIDPASPVPSRQERKRKQP
jgi:uncharacterized protein